MALSPVCVLYRHCTVYMQYMKSLQLQHRADIMIIIMMQDDDGDYAAGSNGQETLVLQLNDN